MPGYWIGRQELFEALTPLDKVQKGMTVRVWNSLQRYDIWSLQVVQRMTDEELLALHNFGKKSLVALRTVIPAPVPKEET